MGEFSNAKKVLSLVLGLMNSGALGVSAGTKKSAGVDKEMRERALGADNIRMKKGKGARGNFFVDKDGKIKLLNIFGPVGAVSALGFEIFKLSKNGTVSEPKVEKSKDEVSSIDGPKVEEDKSEVSSDFFVSNVSGKGENISDPGTIKELASGAWDIERNRKNGDKKFALGRFAQNIKLAFPGYFTKDVLSMSSIKFELYLLCRIVKDTFGGGGLLRYKPGQKCRISAGPSSGKSIGFGVSPEDYRFSWKIEGNYSEVPGRIAREGTSDMSTVGLLGFFGGNTIDIAAKVRGGIDCAVFGQFFSYTRERLLYGGYHEFIEDILVDRYGIIGAEDLLSVWRLLAESYERGQEYRDFKGMMYEKKGIMLSPKEKLKEEGFERYSMKTLKQALCLMDLFVNVHLLESFVSVGAKGGSYSEKVPQAGVAVAALYIWASEFDGVDLSRNNYGDNYLKKIWASVKDKLPDYGIGKAREGA